jgi:cell division protein FtsB
MNDFIRKLSDLRFKKKLILVISVLAFIFGFILFSPYGVIKSIKLASEKKANYEKLKHFINENDSLRKKIKEMYTDKLEIERIAREKYGMIKKGEKMYIKKYNDDD